MMVCSMATMVVGDDDEAMDSDEPERRGSR
jgi:hypothetical protein